ncbi:MAG: GTPase [Gemmataceae bacterium]
MFSPTVQLLTPPGSGAIAVIDVTGRNAWTLVSTLFRTASGKPLPEQPSPTQTWFGKWGEGSGDEVVVSCRTLDPVPAFEIHSHGGRQVVRWIIEQLVAKGCRELAARSTDQPWSLLERAPTLRTANILLDQCHGAFAKALRNGNFDRLAALAPLGRHLIEPWNVVIAGPPNAGKSSLVNALAGFQRSIVSPLAGTTRDVVTTRVAFDGWPIELSDTAGLREGMDDLESEGIERARRSLQKADLVVWLYDGGSRVHVHPDIPVGIRVINKVDDTAGWDWSTMPRALKVSAKTMAGIAELITEIVRKLVPIAPEPGEGVPFTPLLADLAQKAGHSTDAREQLSRMFDINS